MERMACLLLLRLRARRIVEQRGGKLHASGGAEPQELAACRQRQGWTKVAAILSVVESCKRLRIPVNDYMLDVLPGMASRTTSGATRLTPACWAASRA